MLVLKGEGKRRVNEDAPEQDHKFKHLNVGLGDQVRKGEVEIQLTFCMLILFSILTVQ